MQNWNQFHGNGSNHSYMPVHTTSTLQPKWVLDVGQVGFVSPVIGDDGVIYIGCLNGELVAVTSAGNIKWKRMATVSGNPDHPGVITGAPAIDNDGNIYVITTVNTTIDDRRTDSLNPVQIRRSSLHSFTPAGNRRWSYRFPIGEWAGSLGAYTTASPKISSGANTFVFLPAIYISMTIKFEIIVLNQSGNFVNKIEVASYPMIAKTENEPHFRSRPEDFAINVLVSSQNKIRPEPTFSLGEFETNLNQTIVVVSDNYKTLATYRWNFPVLTLMWAKQAERISHCASPVICSENKVLLANDHGILKCFDLQTGEELGKPWHNGKDPIWGTPIVFQDNTYFISGNKLIMLNKDFNLVHEYILPGQCFGAIAMSANHIYVSTTVGLYALSLDFKEVHKNDAILSGVSTPAISAEGMVYVIDHQGKLYALG